MKKVMGILAVVIMSVGLFSCEDESSADQALYDTVAADTDGDSTPTDGRD